ncbi:hypothetical protein FB03_08740 [Actinotignum schaalii]|nr:hypothetical protein FB03_08740 [Actinotignum schaalii]
MMRLLCLSFILCRLGCEFLGPGTTPPPLRGRATVAAQGLAGPAPRPEVPRWGGRAGCAGAVIRLGGQARCFKALTSNEMGILDTVIRRMGIRNTKSPENGALAPTLFSGPA